MPKIKLDELEEIIDAEMAGESIENVISKKPTKLKKQKVPLTEEELIRKKKLNHRNKKSNKHKPEKQ